MSVTTYHYEAVADVEMLVPTVAEAITIDKWEGHGARQPKVWRGTHPPQEGFVEVMVGPETAFPDKWLGIPEARIPQLIRRFYHARDPFIGTPSAQEDTSPDRWDNSVGRQLPPPRRYVRATDPWESEPSDWPTAPPVNIDAWLGNERPPVWKPKLAHPASIEWEWGTGTITPPSTPDPVPKFIVWMNHVTTLEFCMEHQTTLEFCMEHEATQEFKMGFPMSVHNVIRMFRGEDLTIRFKLAKPESISGWSITFEVEDALSGTTRITKTIGSGITVASTPKGWIDVALAAANTSSLTPEGYIFNVRRTDSGNNRVLSNGEFILEQATTE